MFVENDGRRVKCNELKQTPLIVYNGECKKCPYHRDVRCPEGKM